MTLLARSIRVLSLLPALALGGSLLAPPGALAEGWIPSEASARVDVSGPAPGTVPVPAGGRVRFENTGAQIARVELDLPRGVGVTCAAPGESASRGRKFLVEGGGSLECEAPPESVAYRVLRSRDETAGRIVVETGPR